MGLLVIVVSALVAAFLAFSGRLNSSTRWKAMVTPLASIMGSGFLVSAPLLAGIVGIWAVVCMGVLLLLAYGVGSAIRFNIRYFEPIENEGHAPAQSLALLSRLVLSAAYFISVTYYLQLLSAFLLNFLGSHSPFYAHVITTVLLLLIGLIGIWRGLDELEAIEKYAVSLNLGMIVALLISLLVYNIQLGLTGSWSLPNVDSQIDLQDLRILLGLLIVVQGFETSRYLGVAHSADERIQTMRLAQILSAGIYLLFIGLATVLFQSNLGSDVTAIITMTKPVSIVLPVLLSIAAIGSQFSAAVADNSGAGGLIEELTHRRLPIRYAYLIILLVTVAITWETDVNGIIAYASRAFALYYMLQCLVACFVISQQKMIGHRPRQILFLLLSVVCLLVFLYGLPSE